MTGDRLERYRVAETDDQGPPNEPAEGWADAEAWDYDEARADPEAYDRLEFRVMSERAQRPEFSQFRAAMADFPEVGAEIELPPEPTDGDEVGWLEAVKTLRFWSNALWLTGAACAGVVAGLVSTNLVALALNPDASSVLAGQSGTAGGSPPALSARAPSATTAMAALTVRAPARPDAVLSTPAGGLTPSRPAAAPGALASLQTGAQVAVSAAPAAAPMAPLQVAALVAPESSGPKLASTRVAPTAAATGPAPAAPEVAWEAPATATPPAPGAVLLAALAEPAQSPTPPTPSVTPPATSAAPPTQSVTPRATAVVEIPAVDREAAPVPPPAVAAARPAATPPAAPATVQYRVQLALLRDEQNAKYVWHDFVDRVGSPAKDLHQYLFPTRTAHGVRHLLQVGPFGDQDHAEAMCNKLKERGGDCLVVRQPS